MRHMRYVRCPTCLDESAVGADGRDVGKLSKVQTRLEELFASEHAAAAGAGSPVAAVSAGNGSAELLARADAICARNGLASYPIAARQPAVSREIEAVAAPGRQADLALSGEGDCSDRSAAGEPTSATARQLWQLTRHMAKNVRSIFGGS
jgi:hypothetical protein